ncbi:TPA: DNA polymerase I [Legionella pneumophila]|uniref:DNA polymerase I n=2 Tax=Legionella pneumophila TaxID=446 RepID=Q5ZZB2_LEGPH|nr:DNA polymerase I [Legionella pneumophila]AAU26206.1 DNA polymerase I [Legionella pneumophila subsp. pneumophila str. Philadelphia 1]AEW50387.1 DNA polymerase I [Legionella pneumophila subsp. pneumophila ATCC 43290]AGH55231.1 DNA polymerase I [Legionella pneumophila subsp. pneumophila LPE509]AGN13029.1 DNA polymerase I [Legionella pneumophila subsp. pneumophila str. Thunder Bay]AOU03258.1 DNA polymerase I [Legionella pneumophila]
MKPPLILIDGSSYFFRAFHALPPLTNSKGQPTGAIYGVANMIKKIIKDYQPEEIAVVFDAKGKTFRDEWYPEYKAHRPPMPQELSSQFQPLIQLLQAMGLPLLIIDGVEADDVIGTLAKQATEQGIPVVISTGDKDMAQLVNEHVSLINTMSNYSMDIDGVKAKFGVTPEQIIDYLTLIGDSVDNIPGVEKCGPKTAVKWLTEYQTLDNLLAHANEIGGKIGEYLRASIPHLPLSKKLVTIKTDLDLPLNLNQLMPKPADSEQLIKLTRELEFKSWLKELLQEEENQKSPKEMDASNNKSYEIITTHKQLNHWLNKLEQSQQFCIDTETTNLDVMQAELVGISLAVEEENASYIPLAHTDGSTQLVKEEVLTALKPILENPAIGKIGQNIKYDYSVLKNYGITLKGIGYDTMLESYVLNSGAGRHDMDSLALKYLGYKTISYEDVAGKGAKQLRFDQIPVVKAGIYAAEDADITLRLHHKLYPMLDESLRNVLHDIEIPLLTVLADMEMHGVLIDPVILEKHGSRLKEQMKSLEQEAVQLAGKAFNLNSPKQLQEILFDEQKLPVVAKTPTGQPSTAESVLQELAFDYRLPAVILEYRSLSKLVSTYIDALPKRINPKTHRVHTSYNQAVAATGRLSSSDPNLQNIPIRSEEGRLIRTAFIAPEGSLIMAADYSQIELRIMAHLSQDDNLLRAFANGWDIHAATASEIFQTNLDAVSKEQRRRAKAVNFGLIYGMSAFGLAKQIGVERQDAQHYIDTYFRRYPKVLEYMERTRKQAHQLGYVETLFGRRLYLPEINSRNLMRQKAAERTAINGPMQGTAADIIKKTMLAISSWEHSQKNPSAKMIMQVHDELVFEVRKEAVEECRAIIHKLMEQTVKLSVPLVVSIGTGSNWDDAH